MASVAQPWRNVLRVKQWRTKVVWFLVLVSMLTFPMIPLLRIFNKLWSMVMFKLEYFIYTITKTQFRIWVCEHGIDSSWEVFWKWGWSGPSSTDALNIHRYEGQRPLMSWNQEKLWRSQSWYTPNCVGKNNHKVFYAYILSLWIYLVLVDIMCFLNFGNAL